MFNAIKKHIASFVDVPDNDFSAFENSLKLKNIKKKDYFVKEGQVCDFIGFINSGLFRMFYILNGKEINLHFFLDNEFVVVYNSFLTNTPSKFYIEALEDAELVVFYKKRIQEPKIYAYSSEQKAAAWTTIQQYIKEAFEAYEQLENKRLTSYLWDVLVITLLKIDYFCAPHGTLRNEIEKTIVYLNSKDDYYQRLSGGKEYLKKLQNYEQAKFENDLYKIDVFVPYKFRTNLESIRNILKYAYETAEKEIKAMDYIGATCTLEYGILNLFYSNNVEDSIAEVLTKAMEEASAKPMQQASGILFDAVKKISTTDTFVNAAAPSNTQQASNQSEKKGFFSKLFGN